jgi:hypothetical protein
VVVEDAAELFAELVFGTFYQNHIANDDYRTAQSKLLQTSFYGAVTEEFARHVLEFLSPPSSVVHLRKPTIDRKIQLHM